jgi:carbon monoxide dehydrogenase subunit G
MIFPSRTLSISIDRPPDEVYDFISNPENLPKWAAGLCKSVSKTNADWIAETPQGPMKIRFVEKNDFGILDHYVNPAPGVEVYVPIRVLPNGSGSEVIFTIVRSLDMSDEKFAEDIGLVERDLRTLKNVVERNS